jgi:hypothetical protein
MKQDRWQRLLAAFSVCVVLSGCDEINKYETKQADIERRVQQLEKQLIEVKAEWSGLAKESKVSPMSFNRCVYENMRGIASDLAAKSIKVACLRENSIPIPIEDMAKLKGLSSYGSFNNYIGYEVQLTNNSEFTITEVTLGISVRDGPIEYYRIDDFWMPPTPGVVYTGLPPDPTRSMRIEPHNSATFFFGGQADVDVKKQDYKWECVSAKGILTK